MKGGLIYVGGDCGMGVGLGLRRGTIAIRGAAAGGVGWRMRAGSIVVGGDCGRYVGSEMVRGSILIRGGDRVVESAVPSAFCETGTTCLPFLPMLQQWLQRSTQSAFEWITDVPQRMFCGDMGRGGRGEIMVFA